MQVLASPTEQPLVTNSLMTEAGMKSVRADAAAAVPVDADVDDEAAAAVAAAVIPGREASSAWMGRCDKQNDRLVSSRLCDAAVGPRTEGILKCDRGSEAELPPTRGLRTGRTLLAIFADSRRCGSLNEEGTRRGLKWLA